MTDAFFHHNQPPSHIEFASETADAISAWLEECPVVETEEQARAGKMFVDRGRLCLQDLEDDRKAKTRPLYKQITDVDDQYRSPRAVLEKILTELKGRLNAWVNKEEEKRRRIAEEARRRADEARRLAREAEAREFEVKDDARHGIIDSESALVLRTREADAAFTTFQKAEREATVAESETAVRIGGGFSRALSTRFKEELVVTDPVKAVAIMGWSERLLDALLKDAREYRRKHERLPDGIFSKGERSL